MLQINPTDQIALVGLGYVGLPLAVEFGKHRPTIGFDIQPARIQQLTQGIDNTREVTAENLKNAQHLSFTDNPAELRDSKIFIVTVPTPVDKHKQPNLKPLLEASKAIGEVIQKGSIVIYESTVFPGATEEVCVPLVEQVSGLKFNKDFFAGYSPERINPGDKEHRINNIIKITSGSTPEAADAVDCLYQQIVTVGTHKASSIKVAEAAKVIENTQRDLNIALINELALLFDQLNIDTQEVLNAAGTKWNFLPFKPGLVGGHCISVDPYYLTYKAQEIGYHPQIILSGRRINDQMGQFVAESVIKLMTKRRIHVVGSKVLVLGLTFKENCPDLRNTRVIDIVRTLEHYNASVDVHDPCADIEAAYNEYQIELLPTLPANHYDAIILAVAHDEIVELGISEIRKLGKQEHVLYDVKSILPQSEVDARL